MLGRKGMIKVDLNGFLEEPDFPEEVPPKMGMGRGRRLLRTVEPTSGSRDSIRKPKIPLGFLLGEAKPELSGGDEVVNAEHEPHETYSLSSTPVRGNANALSKLKCLPTIPSPEFNEICIKRRRRGEIGMWQDFRISVIEPVTDEGFLIWISHSDEDREPLVEALKRAETVLLEIIKVGTVALLCGPCRGRVVILDKEPFYAFVRDLDTGQLHQVPSAALHQLPEDLRNIEPFTYKVMVRREHVLDADRFKDFLATSIAMRARVLGSLVTWDFVPSVVFRTESCVEITRAPTENPIDSLGDTAKILRPSLSSPIIQKLYDSLPGIEVPKSCTTLRKCVITHVEGCYVSFLSESFNTGVPGSCLRQPFSGTVGDVCLLRQGSQFLRVLILAITRSHLSVRLIDRDTRKTVTDFDHVLFEMVNSDIRPPCVLRTSFAELDQPGSERLRDYLLGLNEVNVTIIKRAEVPEVLISHPNYECISMKSLD